MSDVDHKKRKMGAGDEETNKKLKSEDDLEDMERLVTLHFEEESVRVECKKIAKRLADRGNLLGKAFVRFFKKDESEEKEEEVRGYLEQFYHQIKDDKDLSPNVMKYSAYMIGHSYFLQRNGKGIRFMEISGDMGDESSMSEYITWYCFDGQAKKFDIEKVVAYIIQMINIKTGYVSLHHRRLLLKVLADEKVEWKEEYHRYWAPLKDLNQQILLLLLISKHRGESSNKDIPSIMIKGITSKIVKYLCQARRTIL